MKPAGRAAVWLIAGLLSLVPSARAAGDVVGTTAQDGWHLTFDLNEPPGQTGSAATWQAALTLSLSGARPVREEIVAIVEGTLFRRVMIPMESDRETGSRQLTLPVHASSNPPLSVHRIDIVFARLRGMKAIPFLKRSVYLTAGPWPERKAAARTEEPPVPAGSETIRPPEPASPDPNPPPGKERPPVAPVQEAAVRETDLTPPAPKSFQDYWQDVQQRITMQFGQEMATRASAPARKPRIGFRLHWNGLAQIVFLERSSGNPQTDRAGLESVVQAQPFPEFPPSMADAHVDVHVDFADAQQPASKRSKSR